MAIMYFVLFGVCYAGTIVLFGFLTARYEGEKYGECLRRYWVGTAAAGLCMAAALRIAFCGGSGCREVFLYALAAGVLAGSLYFGCLTDISRYVVYDFCWYLSLAAMFGIWIQRTGKIRDLWSLMELGAFFAIQQILFARLYGKADCHAFCVLAMFGSILGTGMEGFFRHMILAYGFLILHQGYRRNIAKNGTLKKPAPFLPYITAAFFVNILQLPGSI